MAKFGFGTLVAIGVAGCGAYPETSPDENASSTDEDIINGTLTHFPGFSVAINNCSGVVINPRAILTAGHCHPNPSVPNTMETTTVSAIINESDTGVVFSGNAAWSLKPGYADTAATDLAVVTLPVAMNNVVSAEVWDGTLTVGDQFWIYGWGQPDNRSRYGVVPSINQVTGAVVGTTGLSNWPRACFGDSGGAWATSSPHRVFAVDSRGFKNGSDPCDSVGTMSTAHRLQNSASWIKSFFIGVCSDHGGGPGQHWFDCSADFPTNVGPLRNQYSSKCMDAQNNASAAQTPLWLWPCNAGPAQQFTYIPSTRALRFRDGMCADVQWGNFVAGTPVWLWPCSGGAAQRWVYVSPSTYRVDGTNLCLDTLSNADRTQLTIQNCDSSSSQKWAFQ